MRFCMIALVLLARLAWPDFAAAAEPGVRIGYFANITHAQAIVGRANGSFERLAGRRVEWRLFNAGPTAMEALLSGAIDLAYVGPNPALNAYVRSNGRALRIIAGAASGGASLVVRKGAGVRGAADLRGKRVASPEFGNTQDISLRHWLRTNGLRAGSDLKVMPVKNAEILDLFLQGRLDAAWVPEPWASRLVHEAGGSILVDERTLWPGGRFPTAVLVGRSDFLAANGELVDRLLKAHLEATEWINANPTRGMKLINEELARVTRKPLAEGVLKDAFSRLTITHDPLPEAMMTSAERAMELGFLPRSAKAPPQGALDLSRLRRLLPPKGKGR